MQTTPPGKRIIVALDFPDAAAALNLVDRIDPDHCRVKVGKELFTRAGPDLVRDLVRRGFDVFLDLKFHDIPNTVAGACAAAADLGVWMVNVHAAGGSAMLDAARDAIDRSGTHPLLIAVTVLTSLNEQDLAQIGTPYTPEEQVMRLARLTHEHGLDGVVCSPREVAMLRSELHRRFALVTPGIRPASATADDQQRVMTPADAIRAGSDYLVIGRPVTKSDNPQGVLRTLESELATVLPH